MLDAHGSNLRLEILGARIREAAKVIAPHQGSKTLRREDGAEG